MLFKTIFKNSLLLSLSLGNKLQINVLHVKSTFHVFLKVFRKISKVDFSVHAGKISYN